MLPHPNSVPMYSIYIMEYIIIGCSFLQFWCNRSGSENNFKPVSPEFPYLLTTYIHFRARL